MADENYSIQDLCDQTDLPRRTIHFYIQQEIIPPPCGAGLGAYYTEEHLKKLKLIPQLRSQGLRLDDIRKKFAISPHEEIDRMYADLVAGIPQSSFSPKPSTLPQKYLHYQISDQITLVVPDNLDFSTTKKVSEILAIARNILS